MRQRPSHRLPAVLAALGGAFVAAVGCSDTLTGTLNLITGPDDGFAATPKPTSLVVQIIGSTGDATTLGTTALPTTTGLTLQATDPTAIEVVRVTGFDQAGDAVVSGSSVPFQLGGVSGSSLNLFVQRTGEFGRLPSIDGGTATLETVPSSAPLLLSYSEFLLIADGTGKTAQTQVYDTFAWGVAVGGGPVLTVPPLSVAYVDNFTGTDAADATSISALLTLGSGGKASWLDLTDSTSVDAEITSDAAAPTVGEGTFEEVAGGQSIVSADDGSTFIVGATRRTGKPTKAILHVAANGLLAWYSLAFPRLGAAAAYVPGVGLYVFGGNAAADGSTAPGAEVLQSGTSLAIAQSVPLDTTTGAAAVALDSSHVLLAGGVTATGGPAPLRIYDADGLADDAGPLATATLPVTYVTTQAFALSGYDTTTKDYAAIIVGTQASGVTTAYKVTAKGPTALPFRVPRSHAQAVILPNGALGVVGGDATTIESFIP